MAGAPVVLGSSVYLDSTSVRDSWQTKNKTRAFFVFADNMVEPVLFYSDPLHEYCDASRARKPYLQTLTRSSGGSLGNKVKIRWTSSTRTRDLIYPSSPPGFPSVETPMAALLWVIGFSSASVLSFETSFSEVLVDIVLSTLWASTISCSPSLRLLPSIESATMFKKSVLLIL